MILITEERVSRHQAEYTVYLTYKDRRPDRPDLIDPDTYFTVYGPPRHRTAIATGLWQLIEDDPDFNDGYDASVHDGQLEVIEWQVDQPGHEVNRDWFILPELRAIWGDA